jgi:hypothetical protein
MSDSESDRPSANAEEEEQGQGLLDLTEHMAGRALQKLRQTTSLPRVAEEATTRATRFLSSLNTFGLRFVIGVYLVTALLGTIVALIGVEPVGSLPDWLMHVAMYGVCFGLLALYTTSHREKRRSARMLFCGVAIVAFLSFAMLLIDRVDERIIFRENDVGTEAQSALRPKMTILWGPALMLLLSAVSVFFHWALTSVSDNDA